MVRVYWLLKKLLNFINKHLVIKKKVYIFALAIRDKRQKEFPEYCEKNRDH